MFEIQNDNEELFQQYRWVQHDIVIRNYKTLPNNCISQYFNLEDLAIKIFTFGMMIIISWFCQGGGGGFWHTMAAITAIFYGSEQGEEAKNLCGDAYKEPLVTDTLSTMEFKQSRALWNLLDHRETWTPAGSEKLHNKMMRLDQISYIYQVMLWSHDDITNHPWGVLRNNKISKMACFFEICP